MTQTDVERPEDGGMKPGAIAGGAIVLVVGVTLLLDRTGIVSASFGQLIGPFVLMTIGGLILVEKGALGCGHRERLADGPPPIGPRTRGTAVGLWMIGLGIWMLVSQLHLWGLGYHNSWPLVVILSGVIMLVKGVQ